MSLIPVLVLLVSLTFAADKGGCDFADNLSPTAYQALISKMAAKSFSDDKIVVLQNWAKNNSLGFSSNQTLGVLNQFTMSSDRVKAVQTVSPFILTLECPHIISILQTVGFSSDKLTLLKMLINLANMQDLKINNQTILTCWTASDDIAKAKDIIARAKPRSCLFGPANIPQFAFIIDVSGSMDERFKDQDGSVISRLEYVKRDLLNVMNGTLEPSQSFNIIIFSSGAYQWQPGVQPVTPANLALASQYVKNLRAGGATYMLSGLKLAFSDPKVLGVYFLSDGDPSDNMESIISFAASVKKPVNTIAFKSPPTAAKFLFRLANATHGTFRNIV